MAHSVTRQIERSLTASAELQTRPTDKASIRGNHQGRRSSKAASKGRTNDCKRPVFLTKKTLASWGPSTHEAARANVRSVHVLLSGAGARDGGELMVGRGQPNAELRQRKYFTPADVERLIKEARKSRYGDRDAALILHSAITHRCALISVQSCFGPSIAPFGVRPRQFQPPFSFLHRRKFPCAYQNAPAVQSKPPGLTGLGEHNPAILDAAGDGRMTELPNALH